MGRKSIWIPMGDFQLEGELSLPDGAPALPSAVVAHPHPQYGGNMFNNVVEGVFEGLLERGRAVLRFNFRGVGRSGGASGGGEPEDLAAAVDYLAKATGDPPGEIGVIGYSYGAAVSSAFLESKPALFAAVMIAPPLSMSGFESLERCGAPAYAICGDRDPFCPVEAAEALIERCASPKGLAVVAGADHFFQGDEAAVAAQVELFLQEAALAR